MIPPSKEHKRNGIDVKYTPVNPESENDSMPQSTRNEDLIICDSLLASSFREPKLIKSRVTPGHYLQKLFMPIPQEKNDDKSLEEGKPTSPASLDSVLQDLPLAYSPVTKQIHILNKKEEPVIQNSLNRVTTEPGSFSSTVSSLSDFSPCTIDENLAQGSNSEKYCSSLVSTGEDSQDTEDSIDTKLKKKGLSGFFSKNIFAWKCKSETAEGIVFLDNESSLSNNDIQNEKLPVSNSSREALGSTGLIQLERPAWLPAKPKQEQQAHLDLHEKILSSAKKRELKESKLRKKQLQSQLKAEEELASASKTWTQDILPRWKQMKEQKKTLNLWWQGIPPCVRGKVWRLAISNDLNITAELAMERLKSVTGSIDSLGESDQSSDRESSMELIQLDINRTFPHLCIFQKKGPYYDMLHSLLAAYVCYRPDVGYVQGMSYIAAVLILNMDAPDAFICFCNLLNRPCHRAFYSLDQPLMVAYYATYLDILRENLPELCTHLEVSKLTPDLYLLDWVYTVFSKAMALDLASRVWDIFLRDGDEFIFRCAIGVLKMYQEDLIAMDFLTGSQFLTRLPEQLSTNDLFKSIASIKMSVGKMNFNQILTSYTHCYS